MSPLINFLFFQAIVSNHVTSVQLRHIFGCLVAICAPSEEESNSDAPPPPTSPSPSLPPAKSVPSTTAPSATRTPGGCLAGKRRVLGSLSGAAQSSSTAKSLAGKSGGGGLLLPSGARQIIPRVAPPRTKAASEVPKAVSDDVKQ